MSIRSILWYNISMNEGESQTPRQPIEIGKGVSRPEINKAVVYARSAFADVLHTSFPEHLAWNEILLKFGKYAADAVKRGREAHVPEELIRRFAFDFIEKSLVHGNYGLAVRFMTNMNIGTADQIAYFQNLHEEKTRIARENAKKKAAEEAAAETTMPKRKPRQYLRLAADATIADLYNELNSDEVAEDLFDYFMSEMHDNLPDGLVPRLIDLFHSDEGKTMKVADFFEMDIFSLQGDLPIRLKAKKAKK